VRSPKAFPHYIFYEMGRNFYTFGDRWKFPLSAKAGKAAAQVPWATPTLTAAEALAAIPADFAPQKE